tara:strand:- start:2632 stop:3045 length:414 start_codon:yes stop_codon:yes gene_type:complete
MSAPIYLDHNASTPIDSDVLETVIRVSRDSYANMLLRTLPPKQRGHYSERFKKFIAGWHKRGYTVIPDFAPPQLEAKQWAPSWRRMAKVLLRNDYWCKGLGQTQPKSAAWVKYKKMKADEKASERDEKALQLSMEVL